MFEQVHQAARELFNVPAEQFASTGTTYDRIFTDKYTWNPSNAVGLYPTTTKSGLPAELTPGYYHDKCTYFKLVDAFRSGGVNTKENWTRLFRIDAQKLAGDGGLTWPDALKNDGTAKNDEYGYDDSKIEWTFDVLNPAAYTQPNLYSTAHPRYDTAKLVAEKLVWKGQIAQVTRRYEKFPVLTDWEPDPETGDNVAITRQIVHSTSNPAPTQSPMNEVTVKALGTEFQLVTTRTISGSGTGGLPSPYNIPSYVDFPRFATLDSVDLALDADNEHLLITPHVTGGFNRKMPARIYVEFFSSPPSTQSVFQVTHQDLIYQGRLFNVNIRNVLNDSVHIYDATSTIVEEVTFAASSPLSRTAYLALIGTEVRVAEHVERWRFNLWRRATTFVKLQS